MTHEEAIKRVSGVFSSTSTDGDIRVFLARLEALGLLQLNEGEAAKPFFRLEDDINGILFDPMWEA